MKVGTTISKPLLLHSHYPLIVIIGLDQIIYFPITTFMDPCVKRENDEGGKIFDPSTVISAPEPESISPLSSGLGTHKRNIALGSDISGLRVKPDNDNGV